MKYQWNKPVVVATFHASAPLTAWWAASLWYGGHQILALFVGAGALLLTLAVWVRDSYLDEMLEDLSPTHLYHNGTAIEPPRPLPAFTAEENPSRVRIRPLSERGPYASVAPHDAENENTWTDKEVG